MNPITTIQELHDFYAAIPSQRWCRYERVDKDGRHCAMGHISTYNEIYNVLKKCAIAPIKLTEANDAHGDPRSNVLAFLKTKGAK